jgi:hypothetical protein
MDTVSKEKFDKLVRMEPAALTPGDIEFLKVRQSYLTASDRERYADVLGLSEAKPARSKKDDK